MGDIMYEKEGSKGKAVRIYDLVGDAVVMDAAAVVLFAGGPRWTRSQGRISQGVGGRGRYA